MEVARSVRAHERAYIIKPFGFDLDIKAGDIKMQEIMQDPARQQRGSDRFIRGMRMMSPQQRAQRYTRYNARKEAV
ncbi:MAG: hypothetical protein EBX54_09015, partial [Betaproteobacteria bacterium]|nr:hypothetical protein [Betaproteobacteria bacterium]